MTARIWHPGLAAEGGDGYAEVPDGAVGIMRQSGWLLASERDDHEAAHAEHAARAEQADKTPARPRAGKDAGTAGTEGS